MGFTNSPVNRLRRDCCCLFVWYCGLTGILVEPEGVVAVSLFSTVQVDDNGKFGFGNGVGSSTDRR